MNARLSPVKCVDCHVMISRGYPRPVRCRACNREVRRAKVGACVDCGSPTSGYHTSRCKACYSVHCGLVALAAKNPRRTLAVFHAPHGPIRVPEGHSVYWVRKGEQL